MSDYAHNYTDEKLKELEKRFQDIYKQAEKEVSQKFKEYSDQFAKENSEMLIKLKHNIITDKEYYAWRQKQLMTGKRWQELRDNLAKDYTNANKIAMSAINGYTPDAYAENFNWSTYKVEKDALMDTAFTLYDRQTVERLVRDNPDLLPAPKVDTAKDQRWNKQKITSAITQGILQGESIPKIAKRLQNVGEKNKAAAVRNARTAMTGAQNAGRVDGYERAQEMGIEIEYEWVATLDNRTRHSHAVIDGDKIAIGGIFSNGCRYPGDPNGPPAEIWQCRCTIVPVVKGVDLFAKGTYGNGKLGQQTYEEWKEEHRKALEAKGTTTPIEIKTTAIPQNAHEKTQNALENAYEHHRTQNKLNATPVKELGKEFFAVNYGKLSDKTAQSFANTLSDLISEYDTTLQSVRVMTENEYMSHRNSYAATYHDYRLDNSTMIINPVKCKNYDEWIAKLKQNSTDRWCAEVSDEMIAKYVPTHEFAHTLAGMQDKLSNKTNWLGADYDKIRSFRKEIEKTYDDYLSELKPLQEQHKAMNEKYFETFDESFATKVIELEDKINAIKISDYSLTNSDEFMAEAFTDARLGKGTNPYTQRVYGIINGYFKR